MAIPLNDILKMWEKDSIVNSDDLDTSGIDAARNHAKYLSILTEYKLQLKRKEMDHSKLIKDKWLWYNGKMTKAEMDHRNWPYDPLDGHKVLKADMNYYYNSDDDIQISQAQIDYIKTTVEALEEIVNTIRFRHMIIRNIIENRKFMTGV
jgi:hypothetical protein